MHFAQPHLRAEAGACATPLNLDRPHHRTEEDDRTQSPATQSGGVDFDLCFPPDQRIAENLESDPNTFARDSTKFHGSQLDGRAVVCEDRATIFSDQRHNHEQATYLIEPTGESAGVTYASGNQ